MLESALTPSLGQGAGPGHAAPSHKHIILWRWKGKPGMVLVTSWGGLSLSKRLLNLPLSECILGTEGRGQVNSTCRWIYWDTYSNGGHRQQSNTTKDALKIGKGCENSQMGIGWEGVVNERSCPRAKIWMIQRSRPELGMVISQVSRASTAKVLRQEQAWHLSLWLFSSE